MNVPAVAVVVLSSEPDFHLLYCEITTRLPDLMGQITEIIALTNRNFFLVAEASYLIISRHFLKSFSYSF